jgi:hypothetical protein
MSFQKPYTLGPEDAQPFFGYPPPFLKPVVPKGLSIRVYNETQTQGMVGGPFLNWAEAWGWARNQLGGQTWSLEDSEYCKKKLEKEGRVYLGILEEGADISLMEDILFFDENQWPADKNGRMSNPW